MSAETKCRMKLKDGRSCPYKARRPGGVCGIHQKYLDDTRSRLDKYLRVAEIAGALKLTQELITAAYPYVVDATVYVAEIIVVIGKGQLSQHHPGFNEFTKSVPIATRIRELEQMQTKGLLTRSELEPVIEAAFGAMEKPTAP